MEAMIPWLFLAVTLVGAWFTFNAYVPQRRLGPLAVPSFFAGWLTAELSAHHFAWQLAATLVFVWAGALEAWPGWLGLAVTLASWLGLYGLARRSQAAAPAVEEALVEALGPEYRREIEPGLARAMETPVRPGGGWSPFLLFDPEVRRYGGFPYAPDHGFRGELDVYRPRRGVSGAPVLLQIHGGGWVISQKRHQALPLMLAMARAGWVCVAPNYRLSPAATFPDHLVDLKRALAWVRRNIADFGGDPERVAVTGGSAGGHLSALMALTANDPAYQPGFEDVDTSLVAAVPFYGVYDFTDSFGCKPYPGMERFIERAVLKRPLATHREQWEKASPLYRIRTDAPPFFVLHGTHDSLTPVEEARVFVDLLRKTSRSPVAFAEIPGAQHAFEVFHSLRTDHVVRSVERFLAWAVSRRPSPPAATRPTPRPAQAPRPSGWESTSSTT